jgi:hypothetical protein
MENQKTPEICKLHLSVDELLCPMKAIFSFYDATSQEYQRKELWELIKAALSNNCWTFMNEPGTALDLKKKLETLLCAFFLLLKNKEETDGEVKLEIFPAGSEEQIKKDRDELYLVYDVLNEHRGRIKRLTKLEIANPYLAIKALFEQNTLEEWSEILSEWCEYALSKMTLWDASDGSMLLDLEHLEKMLEVTYLFNQQYGNQSDKDDNFMEQLVRELNRETKHPINSDLLKGFIVFVDSVPPERLNRNLRKMMIDYLHAHKEDKLPEDFDKYVSDLSHLTNLLDTILHTIGLSEKKEDR